MHSDETSDGALHLLFDFELANPRDRNKFLQELEKGGWLHAAIERAIAATRDENKTLRKRIKALEAENATLRKRCVRRLTREQRTALVRKLSDDGLNSTEISEKMTSDGEPISPNAVRQRLSREKRKI